MILEDGTAECDRCAVGLPAYGVLHGMIADAGEQKLIFCYVNGCSLTVTNLLVIYPEPGVCSTTGQPVLWATSDATLGLVLDATDPTRVQRLAFCREFGCSDALLTQIGNE